MDKYQKKIRNVLQDKYLCDVVMKELQDSMQLKTMADFLTVSKTSDGQKIKDMVQFIKESKEIPIGTPEYNSILGLKKGR